MILLQAVTAYVALGELSKQEFSFRDAYALFGIREKLRLHAEFYAQEELKLAARYGKTDESGKLILNGNNTFDFKDKEGARSYNEKKRELACMEIKEPDFPVEIAAPSKISPYALEALALFVRFKEEV